MDSENFPFEFEFLLSHLFPDHSVPAGKSTRAGPTPNFWSTFLLPYPDVSSMAVKTHPMSPFPVFPVSYGRRAGQRSIGQLTGCSVTVTLILVHISGSQIMPVTKLSVPEQTMTKQHAGCQYGRQLQMLSAVSSYSCLYA
jgi:hypothetical protein